MAVFDHFGGLWWLTHRGMQALPGSLTVTTLCCLAGAALGASAPRVGPPSTEPAAQ
jgi:hypothetical protein